MKKQSVIFELITASDGDFNVQREYQHPDGTMVSNPQKKTRKKVKGGGFIEETAHFPWNYGRRLVLDAQKDAELIEFLRYSPQSQERPEFQKMIQDGATAKDLVRFGARYRIYDPYTENEEKSKYIQEKTAVMMRIFEEIGTVDKFRDAQKASAIAYALGFSQHDDVRLSYGFILTMAESDPQAVKNALDSETSPFAYKLKQLEQTGIIKTIGNGYYIIPRPGAAGTEKISIGGKKRVIALMEDFNSKEGLEFQQALESAQTQWGMLVAQRETNKIMTNAG
jgi:hypothetical protein